MKKSSNPFEIDQDHEDFLTLSLSTGHNNNPTMPTHSQHPQHPPLLISTPSQPLSLFAPVPQPPPQPPPFDYHLPYNPPAPHHDIPGPSRQTRARRPPVQTLGQGKTETIPAPYTWATKKRATVHTLDHLLSNGINKISGLVQCKKCDKSYEIEYDLHHKFMEIGRYVSENKLSLRDRAPAVWTNPTLPNCKFCDQNNCMKPVITKKRSINWLFLLLGQMLGCCKLSELKYFCKHTSNHRTGAKDRLVYLTYLGLCKQLDPNGPFDIY